MMATVYHGKMRKVEFHQGYECPCCGDAATTKEWNDATMNDYGPFITTIEESMQGDRDACFTCPHCTECSEAHDIEEVSIPIPYYTIPKDNKEASEVLRKG